MFKHFLLQLGIACLIAAISYVLLAAMDSFYDPVYCINATPLRYREQLTCAPGKEATVTIEREYPDDIKFYKVEKESLPEMTETKRAFNFSQAIDGKIFMFSCCLLETSEIEVNCSHDSNVTWYLLDNDNRERLTSGKNFSYLTTSQGRYVIPRSGQYHVVSTSNKIGMFLIDFHLNLTYKLYDLTKSVPEESCNETSCSYQVSSDDVIVLQNNGSISSVSVYYSGGVFGETWNTFLGIELSLIIIGFTGIFLHYVFNKKKGTNGNTDNSVNSTEDRNTELNTNASQPLNDSGCLVRGEPDQSSSSNSKEKSS